MDWFRTALSRFYYVRLIRSSFFISLFYLPNDTTVCTSASIQFRRAGQQGPTITLTAALKQLLGTYTRPLQTPDPHFALHLARTFRSATAEASERRGRRGRSPRNVESTGARVSFRTRNIFPHLCMLLLKLPLFVVMLPTYNYNVTLSWYYCNTAVFEKTCTTTQKT